MADTKTYSRSEVEIIRCFRGRPQLTRAEIQELTGLSRVTVSQAVQALFLRKLITEFDSAASNGGRKASYLSLNPTAGYIGIVYFSATTMSIAVSNLTGQIIDSHTAAISIEDGPERILPTSIQKLQGMLKTVPKNRWMGIVIGVPGPVSHNLGRVISPPIMRGWDGINFHTAFFNTFNLPIHLENDVNLLAIAEHQLIYPTIQNLLVIKVATGIGSGLIINGQLHRGSSGSAGDIGHVQLDALKGLQCRCGHTDCIESFASGWALSEKLNHMGYKVTNTSDIAELCRKGDSKVLHLLIEASSYIGHAVADAVNVLNPGKVVIVGRLVDATDLVLATIKEVVYQRAGALATKNLEILGSKLSTNSALLGSAQLGLDRFFFKVEIR